MDQGSLSQRDRKFLLSLRERRRREAEGAFLAEGVRVVEDLLASEVKTRFLVAASPLAENERGERLLREAGKLRVPVRWVEPKEFAALADTQTPQGVLAVAEVPERRLGGLRFGDPGDLLLVVDAVQDPGNLGTLLRTAEALGVAAVVGLPGTADPWNPKTVRSAAGSLFRVPWLFTTWDQLAPWLREHGATALASQVGAPPPASNRARPVALVVGNEGAGVSAESLARTDARVGIPLRGRAESLNVGAAAAILLYLLLD